MEDLQSLQVANGVRPAICKSTSFKACGSEPSLGLGDGGIHCSSSHLHEIYWEHHGVSPVRSYNFQLQVLDHGNWRCWLGQQGCSDDLSDAVCRLDTTSHPGKWREPPTVDDV